MDQCLSLQWCNEMCVKSEVSYRGLLLRDLVRCRVDIRQGTRVVHGFQPLSRCRLLENFQRCSNEQGSEPTDLTFHKGLPKPKLVCLRLVMQSNCACSWIRTCCNTTKCGQQLEHGTHDSVAVGSNPTCLTEIPILKRFFYPLFT